jgi:dihydroorotase
MFGQMHEGIQSTMLGLKGMPRVAEEIVVSKNLEILGYAGGRLHLSKLSTAKSVDLVRSAKKKMKITCNIASYQPLLDDKCVAGFETSYKVNPPLREKADQDALIKGIRDGTIDVICSGHVPQDEESKKMEFDQAEFGMINLQTFAANLVALTRWVDYTTLIERVTANPRRLLNLEVPGIETDAVANLTLLDPGIEWILDDSTNRSRSKNSPWWGKKITGKAVAVFNNSRFWTDQ